MYTTRKKFTLVIFFISGSAADSVQTHASVECVLKAKRARNRQINAIVREKAERTITSSREFNY